MSINHLQVYGYTLTHIIQKIEFVSSWGERYELVFAPSDALVKGRRLYHPDSREISGDQTTDGLRAGKERLSRSSFLTSLKTGDMWGHEQVDVTGLLKTLVNGQCNHPPCSLWLKPVRPLPLAYLAEPLRV